MKGRPFSRGRRRGFTLVELLVAMVAGLIVTLGAFAFAKATTNSFQQEARIANATVAATLGFRRLVGDLQRASFLSTPNIQRDYVSNQTGTLVPGTVCVQPSPTLFPAGIVALAGIRIEATGYPITGAQSPVTAENPTVTPDRVTLAGAFTSTEQFYVRDVLSVAGAGATIDIQPNSGAFARTAAQVVVGSGIAPWDSIFPQGRILRIVDQNGFQQFGIIQSTAAGPNATIRIQLASTPAVYTQATPPPGGQHNPACVGIAGLAVGAMVNTVNLVRYEIRDMRTVTGVNPQAYAPLYANPTTVTGVTLPAPPGDDSRFELVRYEIDPASGAIIAGTEQLVAEYAVDLRFGLTVDVRPNPQGSPQTPLLQRFFPGNAAIYQWAGVVGANNSPPPGPERIRAVSVRFAVRSRQGDRSGNSMPALLPALDGSANGSYYRYQLPGVAATSPNAFARVRTMQAEVTLENQAGVFW